TRLQGDWSSDVCSSDLVAQLATLWGCSKQHVCTLIDRGHLPAVRIGSLIRLRPDDVREYETRRCLVQEPRDRNFRSHAEDAGTRSEERRVGKEGESLWW